MSNDDILPIMNFKKVLPMPHNALCLRVVNKSPCRLSGSAISFLITYWLRLPFDSNTFGLQAAPCYTGFLNIEFLFVFQYRKGYS